MKRSNLLLLLMLALALAGSGCKKTPKGVTNIPGSRVTVPPTGPAGPAGQGARETANTIPPDTGVRTAPIDTSAGTPLGSREEMEGMLMDRAALQAQTVYFDFDKSAVKKSETGKLEAAATFLKNEVTAKLLIEGHCDERGTEEYNRALGERRALALREYLVHLGITANRVFTKSWGEDKPADAGHDDAAWAKNRRGEFVVLRPKP